MTVGKASSRLQSYCFQFSRRGRAQRYLILSHGDTSLQEIWGFGLLNCKLTYIRYSVLTRERLVSPIAWTEKLSPPGHLATLSLSPPSAQMESSMTRYQTAAQRSENTQPTGLVYVIAWTPSAPVRTLFDRKAALAMALSTRLISHARMSKWRSLLPTAQTALGETIWKLGTTFEAKALQQDYEFVIQWASISEAP